MKKEQIDFDLDDIEVAMALEEGHDFWIDVDRETVGRCYCINYITAPDIIALIDNVYNTIQIIGNELYFLRLHSICAETYPDNLYSKIYTIFKNEDDLIEDINYRKPSYNKTKIKKAISWLNRTFPEKVIEPVYDYSTKRKCEGIYWGGFDINQNNKLKLTDNDLNKLVPINFNQIYKLENQVSIDYTNDCSFVHSGFVAIIKNKFDADYNELINQKTIIDIRKLYPYYEPILEHT